jgi:hypothetical protein
MIEFVLKSNLIEKLDFRTKPYLKKSLLHDSVVFISRIESGYVSLNLDPFQTLKDRIMDC